MSMTPDEYQYAALRTERTPNFVTDVGTACGFLRASELSRLLHGMIGVCTEAGELQDMVKKNLIYGKPFDRVNVMEECGDLCWYIVLCLDACGFKFSEALTRNITKLRTRFPDQFTSEAALNRDLDAERKVLEDVRRPNPEITDMDPDRDADHALEAFRRVAHALGVDSPIKVRDPSNKRIAELCVRTISYDAQQARTQLTELNTLRERIKAFADVNGA